MLKKIYDVVEQHGGLTARITLVSATGLSTAQASTISEDEEMIKLLKDLVRESTGINVEEYLND